MKWAIDPSHSSVTFTIRHMMSKVRGQMKVKEGYIEVDNDNLNTAKVDVVLDAATVDTGVEMRDNHLRSADGHFDVEKYPTITFKSTRVEGKDPSNFKVIGEVTIRGKSKVVTDGPYAESKDIVGGYTLIQAKDLGEAAELSKGCPIFESGGLVEVRPVMEM